MKIPEAHLPARALRSQTNTRAFPLIGPGLPLRSAPDPAQLHAIIGYLGVERSPRYQPSGGQTFCNIYAYDFSCLARVYLPRVWWTPAALAKIEDGLTLAVKYGETVTELNANALYLWLVSFGPQFGWRRVADLNELQAAANRGHVATICALRTDKRLPGHIAMVVPETAETGAVWRGGHCLQPVQSQAGVRNVCASPSPGRWWEHERYQASGFWIHD